MTFASRVKNLKASGIREIFDLSATIEKCINLSIGQADFEVPAPIRRAAASAIEEGHNRYTPSGGIPELREGVLRQVRERTGARVNSALITSGASGGLVLGLLALVEYGDEVLIPDPYFVLYKALVELCGGVPVYYDTYPDFRPRRSELESKITEKTKLILINSPSNPTGVCYSTDDLKMIADVAAKKRLLVLSDEIYFDFVYDSKPVSMLHLHLRTGAFPEGLRRWARLRHLSPHHRVSPQERSRL
jgi:aspartate aminotransferase/aminotransferase